MPRSSARSVILMKDVTEPHLNDMILTRSRCHLLCLKIGDQQRLPL